MRVRLVAALVMVFMVGCAAQQDEPLATGIPARDVATDAPATILTEPTGTADSATLVPTGVQPATLTPLPLLEIAGQILYANSSGLASDVYVMNADGSNHTLLTPGDAAQGAPVWSPDGTQIAYLSEIDERRQLVVMNADGSNPVVIAEQIAFYAAPAWSPDGTQIVYVSARGGDQELAIINADGTNPRALTENTDEDFTPAWSPDGRRIAFSSTREQSFDIYVMNPDGSNVIRLTDSPAIDLGPVWSPDGTRIAFRSDRDNSEEDIYIMNADGSNVIRLSDHAGADTSPTWSPDGMSIAYSGNSANNSDIYVVNVDGSNRVRLTDDPSWDGDPVWSPDGQWIAFSSSRNMNSEIYLMRPDGSQQTRLTSMEGSDTTLSWRPDPSAVPSAVLPISTAPPVVINTACDVLTADMVEARIGTLVRGPELILNTAPEYGNVEDCVYESEVGQLVITYLSSDDRAQQFYDDHLAQFSGGVAMWTEVNQTTFGYGNTGEMDEPYTLIMLARGQALRIVVTHLSWNGLDISIDLALAALERLP